MLSDSQLHWRCRRGVRELDVLFTRYVNVFYPQLDDAKKATFQDLLEVQDPVIMDWLFGKYDPEDPRIKGLIDELKEISGLV